MLQKVLESVSEMLGLALAEQGASLVYIKCAKSLLDKTIAGISVNLRQSIDLGTTKSADIPTLSSALKPKEPLGGVGSKSVGFEVDNGRLVKMIYESGIEVEPETMVMLDGIAMEYKEAKGKAFQSGSVL